MLESDPLRHAPLPRTLTHSRLFRQSTARRLFKARHLELELLEIRSAVVSVTTEESVAPTTIYAMAVRNHQPSRGRRSSLDGAAPWVLEHRYSEFYEFRRTLLRRIQQWEVAADNREKETKEFMAISNALRRPFTPDFPRRHMSVDTVKIIEERRVGLQEFVRNLIIAYVDVSIYLLECAVSISDTSRREMAAIERKLEQFLNVPESQKELERYRTAVIRSLTDVDETHTPGGGDEEGFQCCICMNDGTTQCAVERLPGDDKLVRLPCFHHFHEDCVIDWFSTSTTCPLCRREVVDPSYRESIGSPSVV